MIFDLFWELVLPLAARKYRAVRIFVMALLLVAAALTVHFS
jgi:hypothetical protein